jgi:nucleotide-binding universal stress UspA family protein
MMSASYRALGNAIHFARRLDATLTVLTVAQAPFSRERHVTEQRSPLQQGPPEEREPHHKVFDDFLSKFDFHLVRSEKVMRLGDARREVVKLAREIAADLIVMGSASRTGLAHVLIGGVARRVAQVLPCSIITVRSESPIRLAIEGKIPRAEAVFCATHPAREHCDRFQHGDELLSEGLAHMAIKHYQACIAEYDTCANAWLQLSEAHARIGDSEKAQHCAAKAQEALRRQEYQPIEDEAQGTAFLHRRMFGI